MEAADEQSSVVIASRGRDGNGAGLVLEIVPQRTVDAVAENDPVSQWLGFDGVGQRIREVSQPRPWIDEVHDCLPR